MKWNNWLFTNYIRHIQSYDHTNWYWAELECEATVEGFGTANLSRLVSSPNVKTVFEKRRLQTYCLDSSLACSALQGIPSPSAHSWALCKNETIQYTNETVIPMISATFLLAGEHHLSHKLFKVCCVSYNIVVIYWFILNLTLDIWSKAGYEQIRLQVIA
jgi:hypothetical protein